MSKVFPSSRLTAVLAFTLASITTVSAQSADVGKKVYTDQKCSICHSVGGVGNKKGPLEDAAKLSADEIRQWITDAPAMTAKKNAARKPAMKAYNLPKEDVDGLVAYIQSLKK